MQGLKDAEATAAFCSFFNDLFDSLNRKSERDAIRSDSNDLKVIESSLKWLDGWNDLLLEGRIQKNEFLTYQTYEGLRLTLQSTIDLCSYMIYACDFDYFLTGNINQDPLERFFGIIRHVSGSNDHPAVPNFLQLYKILSCFSLIRPPKYGNCSVEERTPPQQLIKLSTIKEIYGDSSTKNSALDKIKEKLDSLVELDNWEYDDVIGSDHDYHCAPVADCFLYYITGLLGKHIIKWTKCDVCKAAITNPNLLTNSPAAELANQRAESGFVHTNRNLFSIVCALEKSFEEHCKELDLCEKVTTQLLEEHHMTFPCSSHGDEVMSYMIHLFLKLRMQQFAYRSCRDKPRENRDRKKIAKFFTT
ncbi:uncharacterized protein LOC124164240 [Ischnura elegans]|uniref:uncharacterized protein LOC124164240 n=1 Tax=Ischnura elegans TaxID=197161 RepID=UPI001ED89454|nr:uncharacterized protein LOC124164240 [Ischnura elegans]